MVHSLAPAAGALRGAPERSPWHSRHSASQCAAQLLLKQQHSHLQRPRCLPRRRKRTSSAAEGDRARVSGLLRTLARCEWFEWRTAHLSHTTAACSNVLPSKRRMSALSAGCQELSRARCSTLDGPRPLFATTSVQALAFIVAVLRVHDMVAHAHPNHAQDATLVAALPHARAARPSPL